MQALDREIKTVMHELKRRELIVKRIEQITPKIKKITFTGPELSDFVSLSPDDHIKAFFGEPDAEKPVMRDYTPTRYDNSLQELDLEFYLNGKGPGALWAEQASVGSTLTIGGPRGSRIVPYNFDWYLMIGDETAIPSMERRLSELPSNATAIVIVEVDDEAHQVQFPRLANVEVHWVYRQNNSVSNLEILKNKVLKVTFPHGDYFEWIACEKSCAMALKDLLVTVKGGQEDWIKATGYWHR